MSNEGENSKITVPKFSSFKSKAPKADHPSREDKLKDENREAGSRRSGHRSDKPAPRERHHREESKRHHKRHRTRSPGKDRDTQVPSKEVPPERPKSDLYVFDTKGDHLIRKYGGIGRSQIVPYHRHGSGKVLGTTGRLMIDRDGPRDFFNLRMPGDGSTLSRDKDGLRSRSLRLNPRPVRIKAKVDASLETNDDFLSLGTSRKRKHSPGGSGSSDPEEQPSYRSIEGKAKSRRRWAEDSDSDAGSSDVEVDADQDNPLRWKSIQLSRQVKENPGDIDAWMQLVDHQDVLLRAGESIDHKALENETHSYGEIKLHMLETALSNVTNPYDRSRVLVCLMREGVKIWNSKTAAKKWSEVLDEENDSFELWKTHADFLMSDIANFQYDDVKKFLLKRLSQALAPSAHELPSAAFEEAIYVFLRVTRLIHDAGYKELAVAAWQGLLELNFCRPDEFKTMPTAQESFHAFWESEVSRIGDVKAHGWQHYAASGGHEDALESPRDNRRKPIRSRDIYKAWRELERFHAEGARLPARTLDEGTEDDPFRVVLYSDIESLLFFIPDAVLPAVSEQLTDAFLLFCGYPPARRSSPWTEQAYHDQFLTDTGVDAQQHLPKTVDGSLLDDTNTRSPSFDARGLHANISPDLLFPGTPWFRYLPAEKSAHVDTPWLANVLKQLVSSAGMEKLAPYYLAVSFSEAPWNIKKPAKALLKQYPMNADIYNAYALAEFSNWDISAARNVFVSASKLTMSSRQGSYLLWKTWSIMDLELGDLAGATSRLCSSTEDSPHYADSSASSARILKARQTFTSSLQQSLATSDLDSASTYAQCLVFLTYLTAEGCTEPCSIRQGNISAAMSSIDYLSGEFRKRGYERDASHETVLQFGARLLYLNASKGPFRRVYMREQLSRFVGVFPRNTIFLSLFAWADSSLRVVDETRNLLYDKVLTPSQDCVSSREFSIQHEMAHGNSNTTKSAFEHALSSDGSKSSPRLWISYIRFCSSQRELRGKAKDVFYRAMRHCPWSKEVMMEAFATLAGEMKAEELRAVYSTMASKGLRIHVDLEDFVKEQQANDAA